MRFVVVSLLFIGLSAAGQNTTEPVKVKHYIMDSFREGQVKLKSGEVLNHVLNYNLITKEMIFKQGEQYLAIAQPETIDTVFIGQRKFVWEKDNGFYEWLSGVTYPLFAEYTCTVKEPGVQTGFGSSNTTASVTLKSLITDGGAYGLKLPDGFEVLPRRSLLIRQEGKFYKIKNEQQLVKLFPGKKEVIKGWISSHKTDFSDNDEVALLVQQIQ